MIPGLEVDLDGDLPVYRQIAEGIRSAASAGRLPSGLRLPPTRALARRLGVNRNTVIAAYDLLAAEGIIRSHTGRGTYLVAAPAPDPQDPVRSTPARDVCSDI